MTKLEAISKLVDYTSKYQKQVVAHFEAEVALTGVKQALSDAKESVLTSVDPKELGSNAEIREANLNNRLATYITAVREADLKVSTTNMELTLAKSDVSMMSRIVDALSSPEVG